MPGLRQAAAQWRAAKLCIHGLFMQRFYVGTENGQEKIARFYKEANWRKPGISVFFVYFF